MSEVHSITTIQKVMGGVLAIDKPSGISSHTVVNWARKVFGIRTIGHTGTLDPLASGLLLLLVGRAFTKKQSYYLRQDKEYLVTAQLGVETDTYDTMGREVARCDWKKIVRLTDAEITSVLESFVGESTQQVPAFSAVKKGGEKLYDLALSGALKESDKPMRKIVISSLHVLNITTDTKIQQKRILFSVACGSGTYIRSLVHDVGRLLGCGAIVTQLRRTAIGTLSLTNVSVCPIVPKQYYLYKK